MAAPSTTALPPHADDARAAGLRHSTDAQPGIRRRRAGGGFRYTGPDGAPIRDRDTLDRIRALAIPPAWTDVWICRSPNGHLQATGRDARGRKQHRYHPDFRAHREASKFDRMVAFARALPAIRARVERDLRRPGLPRDKVLAAVVRLLELTLIRVGNEEYARLNRSFGLTTLRDRHAQVDGTGIRFRFRGKSGRQHEVGLRDRRLAGIVRRCQELPGQELFQYVAEDGTPSTIASEDVNDYLRAAAGAEVSAKDFRTWAGTVLAYRRLRTLPHPTTERAARRNVVAVMRHTAEQLGNTPAVARSSYVHPALVDAYLDEAIPPARDLSEPPPGDDEVAGAARIPPPVVLPTPRDEADVVRLLRRAVQRDARRVADPRRRPAGQVSRRSSSR
jgi:DNA topoisomerase-1